MLRMQINPVNPPLQSPNKNHTLIIFLELLDMYKNRKIDLWKDAVGENKPRLRRSFYSPM